MSNARELALKAIYRINEEGAFSNLVLNELLNKSNLDQRDKALTTQLVYGSIRYRNSLDWVINHFSTRKVKKMTPWVRNALRLGVYQIDYLDKIPAPVAANETVEVAKEYCNRGAVKFINGNLRNIAQNIDSVEYPDLEENPVQHIRHCYSYPQWIVQRWVKRYGREETIEICQNLNQIPPTVVRTNTLKLTREELISNLEQEGAEAEAITKVGEAVNLSNYNSIASLKSFQRGEFFVQGLSSMLVAHVLEPTAHDLVIDLCAAPGGKSTHFAQVMNNQGQINAVDLHQQKLDLIQENCDRLGIENIDTYCGDGREITFEQQANKILVDAPCSGLGIIGKKPEIRWQKKPQDLQQLQELQLELLTNAAGLLQDGGELVYSTCTFTPEENQAVIEKFLAEFPQFSLVDLETEAQNLELTDYLNDGMIQILPDNKFLEGFFIAKLVKIS
ncbi:16S rRNA (cytosine(967)-C(5))-methyltransferase RsmB [Halanaerobacter jeridensis]|uniref:16S rRNA (cytosine(967)-C(5))-methyltransferase n=1 Tax=Halanaerobacter jeridensis TaxID=706427 RepID=A0A938XTX8_9FIRM|nr:16S rRNA (cytosine(967)-C(5))-methyltransferase RsmB [Halanaerobacter jeridensis]MBM7555512.1 16S rRNA (cytosine967-C5)-methyltransferase [Halanaerobacter jeridensis]